MIHSVIVSGPLSSCDREGRRAAAADPTNRYCCARSPVDQISPLGASLMIIYYNNNVSFIRLHNIILVKWNEHRQTTLHMLFCSVKSNLTYFIIASTNL